MRRSGAMSALRRQASFGKLGGLALRVILPLLALVAGNQYCS